MWFPTTFISILTLAAASPMGSLQRRVNKEVTFNTQQTFILQPSNSPIVSVWGGVDTYFQGDGNFVVYVGSAIWSSGTSGHNCETTDTCRLAWQGDGNLVIYINGVALWSSGTSKTGLLLTFTAQSYAMEITGVESDGSAPILWHASETGNEADPGPPGAGVCDGESCFTCTNCIVTSNPQ